MSGTFAYGHRAGEQLECFSIPLELVKEKFVDATGTEQQRCGLKVGGGIDQDPTKSPYGYPDTGIYVTHIEPDGPAERAGLMLHDKILQVNGRDFTMVTHEKAVHYIKKYPILKILVSRAGVTEHS